MSREIEIKTIRRLKRFKIKTALSPKEFTLKLKRQFQLQDRILVGYIGEESSVISLQKDNKKYWAPQLQIRIEKDEDNNKVTVIRGMLSPRPSIWIIYVFFNLLGTTGISFFGLAWFVQLRLNVENNLDVWSWISLLILIGAFFTKKIGQYLARKHIKVLRDFMEKVVVEELENNTPEH